LRRQSPRLREDQAVTQIPGAQKGINPEGLKTNLFIAKEEFHATG
jgi:hypothetical protein